MRGAERCWHPLFTKLNVLALLSAPLLHKPRIRDAMVAPSFEVKQKVLQLVVQRIVVEDHRITIEHVVPSGPIRLQPEHHAPAGPASRRCRNFKRSSSVNARVTRAWANAISSRISRIYMRNVPSSLVVARRVPSGL